ncbi:MAG: 30S ribosomal protein S2 [Verrucomicrobiota bacterium]
MGKIDAKTLLEAGVHFGHRTDKWNPKMAPYIYEARNGIHIIDLNKTVEQIHRAEEFLKGVAEKGGHVLFVGTKKAAQETVKELATRCQSYYVSERWLGGMLTNLNTIRKSVKRMQEIDEMEASGAFKGMPKQEVSALRRESAKIHRNLDGIKDMQKQPDAVVIVDVPREDIALTEASKLKIPVVALTDTNAKPDGIQIPIPANDDAIRSVSTILDVLSAAVAEGNVVGSKKRAEEQAKSKKAKAKAAADPEPAPDAPKAKAKPRAATPKAADKPAANASA